MGAVVARWSGLEARALREAKRMSVREFAALLGINVGAVSTWEKRGTRAQLLFETQQLLDTDLGRLDADSLRPGGRSIARPGDGSAIGARATAGRAGLITAPTVSLRRLSSRRWTHVRKI